MRLRQKPWADSELLSNPLFLGECQNLRGIWSKYFENAHPLHLEIGCGKGQFAIGSALENPDINFIAMEKEERIICMALRAAKDAGLTNLRFVLKDAQELNEIFAPGELSRIYINFCDPWRSRGKWRKRRLTHGGFLAKYEELLQDGDLHFKTDSGELFYFTKYELEARKWHIYFETTNLHKDGICPIVTEYEQRFISKGMAIYSIKAGYTNEDRAGKAAF